MRRTTTFGKFKFPNPEALPARSRFFDQLVALIRTLVGLEDDVVIIILIVIWII